MLGISGAVMYAGFHIACPGYVETWVDGKGFEHGLPSNPLRCPGKGCPTCFGSGKVISGTKRTTLIKEDW